MTSSQPPPVTLLVNPVAGAGRARAALPGVSAALDAAGWAVAVVTTEGIAHAVEAAAAAVRQGRWVVTLGGDGLAGRVAGAVAGAGGVLGVLPGGRGNDFTRVLGLPRDPVAAARALATATVRAVDLGEVAGTAFLGIASVGFDSVVQRMTATTRLRLGQGVYAYAALRALASWRHLDFDLILDGAPRHLHGWTVAVANSGVYGGGMRLAPGASLDDGELDVVELGATSRMRFLATFPSVFRGTHVSSPAVRITRARAVRISAPAGLVVYADGDPAGTLPVDVLVRPAALRVLVPAGSPDNAG